MQRSSRRRLHALILLVLSGFFVATVFGVGKPVLPNLDKRRDQPKAKHAAPPEKQKTVEILHARIKDLSISEDDVLNSPKMVGSTRSFLTGPNGNGGAVSELTEKAVGRNEDYRAVKTFLTEHRALFGFGPEALTAAKLHKDYKTKPANFRTMIWNQELDGISVFQGMFKAHLASHGELINVGSHFVPDLEQKADKIANRKQLLAKPPISLKEAIVRAAENLEVVANVSAIVESDVSSGKEQHQHFKATPGLNSLEGKLTWLPMDADTLRLCWQVQIVSRARGEMFRILVDAQTGEILIRQCLTEYLTPAQFNVFDGESPTPMTPVTATTPSTNQPALVSRNLLTITAVNTTASPNGWINDGINTTEGNNVNAQLDRDNDDVPDVDSKPVGSPARVFDFPFDLTAFPSSNADAAVVNLFYWNNWMHDKLYALGFDEASGNFQKDNFRRGGVGGDAVEADGQDASISDNSTIPPGPAQANNANFTTPGDGTAPRMQMYLYTGPTPNRDACFDASTMCHEYTHGLSGRLVGGGWLISQKQTRGMGEGWSDFYGSALLSKSVDDVNGVYTHSSFVNYLARPGFRQNYYFGSRRYPYTTDMTKNPLTFGDIDPALASPHTGIPYNPIFSSPNNNPSEVHNMGEVWCVMLWEVRAKLINRLGFATGNQQMLQLVTDAMKLAAMDPNFVESRNALFQADLALTGGANQADMWAAFAKRGLGYGATSSSSGTIVVSEGYDVPSNTLPLIAIDSPKENTSFPGAPVVSGRSSLTSGQVQIALNRTTDGAWYDFTTHLWTTTPTTQLATGVANWSVSLPTLSAGNYQVVAFAQDASSNQSVYAYRNFHIDVSAPDVGFDLPEPNGVVNNPVVVDGYSQDDVEEKFVRVSLSRLSDGVWYNFAAQNWGTTTFNISDDVQIAEGNIDWHLTLPTLAEGQYQVRAMAVDGAGNNSGWLTRDFTVDSGPPSLTFAPLTNQQAVFNFNQIGGTVSKPATVTFRIEHFISGSPNEFWNGTNWSSVVYELPATVTGNNWIPELWTLPSRGQTFQGTYVITATATDNLNRTGSTNIVLSRTGLDTTLPNVLITSISANQVITNNFLPPINGAASDPESGIASLDVYLIQFANEILYWNGASWTSTPSTIASFYNSSTGTWQSTGTLPSGGNLPNGSYQIQANAQNGESPSGGHGVSVSFVVDYHPVYVWTQGSYFDAISGNENLRWDNPANWDGNVVPSGEAVAIINSGAVDGAGISINIFRFNLNGGSLNTSNMTVKFLNVAAGTLASGNIQIDTNGRFIWSGGVLQSSVMNIPVTGILSMTNTAPKYLYDSRINNSGTILWTGGDMYGQNDWIVNGPTGVFDAQTDNTLHLWPNFGNGYRGMTNYGVFRKSAGSESFHQGTFYNYGIIEINSGSFTMYDAMTLQNGSKINGNGKVKLINGCCGINAEVFGTVDINGTLELSESNTRVRANGGGTLNIGASGKLVMLQGYVGGGLTLTGTGDIQWKGGYFDGTNTIAAGTTVNASGNQTKYLGSGAVLNNAGTINWSGTGFLLQDGREAYGFSAGALNNLSNATFRILNDGQVFSRLGNASIFNNAAGAYFIKEGGANISYITDFVLNNNGTVLCNTGTLNFSDISVPTYFNSGSLLTGNGGVKFDGDIRLAGTVTAQTPLEFSSGNLTGSTNQPTLAASNGLKWTSGTLFGTLDFATNTVVELPGNAAKFLNSGAIINNRGTWRWTGTGNIFNYGRNAYGESPATFNNMPGAKFYALTNAAVFGIAGTPSSFNNLAGATFIRDGDTNLTSFGNFDLNNFGTIQVVKGVLEINATVRFKPGAAVNGAGEIHQTGGTTFVSGTNTIDGALLKLVNGELIGTATNVGTFQTLNNGVFEWTGGNISEVLNIGSNATFKITGPATKFFNSAAVLNNFGSVVWTGSGDVYNYGRSAYSETPAIWNNRGGATFSALNDAAFQYAGSPSVFNNDVGAVFEKNFSTNTSTVYWMFNNNGLVHAITGRIDFAGDGSDTGRYDTETGALIRFTGGNRVLAGSTQLTGLGKIQIEGGTLNANGGITFGTAGQAATLEIISGTLQGTASFSGFPVWNWTGGTISGSLTIPTGTTMNIIGNNTKTLGSSAVFNNQGVVNWSDSGQIYCDGRAAYGMSPAVFNNLSGGVFQMLNDGQPFGRGGDYSTFNNLAGALFVKTGGTNETAMNNFVFNNAGEARAESGTLTFIDYANFSSNSILNGVSMIRLAGAVTMTNLINNWGTVRVDQGTVTGFGSSNNPSMLWKGPGTLEWHGGTLAGNLTLASNLQVNVFNSIAKFLASAAVLNNEGTIDWAGPGQIFCDGRPAYGQSPCIINNRSGSKFRALSDGAVFGRYGDFSTFNNEAGALFEKVGGSGSTVINSFVFNNFGEARASSGTLEFNELSTLKPGALYSGSAAHLFSAGTHLLQGTTTISSPSVTLAGAVLNAMINSNATVATASNGVFNWSGGLISGDFTLGPGGVMEINGSPTKSLDSATVLRNKGSIRWTGTGDIFSDGRSAYGYSPASIINESGALFSVETDASFSMYAGNHVFNNQAGATLRKRVATSTTTCGWDFVNNGTMELQTGTLHFTGNHLLNAFSILQFSVGGNAVNSQYGRILVPGTSDLQGSCSISLTNGYLPVEGETFTIFNYGSRTGQFTPLTLPTLQYPLIWSVDYGTTSLTLKVQRAHLLSSPINLGNGQVQLGFNGPSASSAILEASTNLIEWIPLATNAPFNGTFNFLDPQTTGLKSRFYRIHINQ